MDLSIKDAEHKKHSALFIGGTKNAYPSSTDTMPLARTFSSFFANSKKKKKKKITNIPIRRIQRYYGEVPEKDLLHLLSLKCFYCSSISTKLTFFAIKERLIRIG